MTNSAASHLLPVFARVDLGFERGEGAWLIATNGDRYLDFTSGVAVNALGHAHPHLVAALQEQATKLWHMSNLFKSPDGERLAAAELDVAIAEEQRVAAELVDADFERDARARARFQEEHPECLSEERLADVDAAFHAVGEGE